MAAQAKATGYYASIAPVLPGIFLGEHMPLRQPNDPLNELVLLPLFAGIVPAGTQFARTTPSQTGLERVYVQQIYQMCQGAFPAILISAGSQQTNRNSTSTATGTRSVNVDYYDRWDSQTLPMETIRTNIRLDLERIRANIETYMRDHEGFLVNGTLYPISVLAFDIGDYSKQSMDRFGLGLSLGAARLATTFTILPYQI